MRRLGPLRMLLGGLALITLALIGLSRLGAATPYVPGVARAVRCCSASAPAARSCR